jgi:hypothetical protein
LARAWSGSGTPRSWRHGRRDPGVELAITGLALHCIKFSDSPTPGRPESTSAGIQIPRPVSSFEPAPLSPQHRRQRQTSLTDPTLTAEICRASIPMFILHDQSFRSGSVYRFIDDSIPDLLNPHHTLLLRGSRTDRQASILDQLSPKIKVAIVLISTDYRC